MLPIDLATLASLCGHAWRASQGVAPIAPMTIAMLAAGAVSGVTHCAVMCGPLVLAQVASLPPSPSGCGRIVAGARFPYHLGRLATYAALGAIVGGIGSAVIHAMAAQAAPIAFLLALAAMLTILFGLRGPTASPGPLGQRIAVLARPLLGGGWKAGMALGVILGLLPCGILYGALAVAAASANPLIGMALMLAFGIGTLPGLVAIGTIGRTIGRRLGLKLAPLALALNAGVLGMLALRAWMAI